ncbi:permease of the drug/metabolite transporter (DMT) superfamily [Desulfocucumis palustris]|uniref:Permease of the drug/metabolite transporter (DMT) superfamily n=1 Tax=Desulfocucumis palustris TaxID=1898651 RepID=A0A2L2XIE5_9FIRM|nr:DMT family transporter [Desulfocucumis palustris]GBF35754.1 permease of the drug/metabolite transporter (DMT) superfamily [Desulfocucumis palustris]
MTKTESNIILFSITLCWASSYIFIKNLPPELSAFAYLTMTAGLASIILLIVFFKRLRDFNSKILLRSAAMAAILCVNLIFEKMGIAAIPASTASFIASLNIVIVPLLLLFFRKRPSRNNLLGILIILSGLALSSGVKPGQPLEAGMLYMLSACFLMAVYIICTDRFTKDHDPLLLGVGQMFFTAILSFILWSLQEPKTFLLVNYSNTLLANIFMLAFFSKAYAYIMLMYSQKYASPLSVTVIASTEPIVTMVLAVLIPGTFGVNESFTIIKLAGAVLIAAGAVCAGTDFLNKKEEKPLAGNSASL